jgi:predicted SAM-dependent methyltransferase
MDMHALRFSDASFDLIFASHVFEHAYDFGMVARECVRVLKPDGYIFCAFPTDFELSHHDRVDFKTTDGLLRHFKGWDVEVLHEHRNLNELSVLVSVRRDSGDKKRG